MVIKVIPLGAGQDVGRSCVIVELGGRRLMFDCGIHMVNQQQFPDFHFLQGSQQQPLDFTNHIDCVLITHFHLDHCGALTYFTEGVGYHGPILATPPTKAIIPLMLEDFRKVSSMQQGQKGGGQGSGGNQNSMNQDTAFTSDMIKACIAKISTIQLHETQVIKGDIKVTAYYAGHVLGACMFYVECNGESVVYTGDYNMTADRHLGAAWIDKLRPDVCITETTYATTIRDSKRSREREFLKVVHETLDNGGKVLIPVFALGRAQELCVLLETYWNRTNLQYPIYFSGGLTEKANFYYKLFINWTNEKIKKTFTKNQNMFQFQHVKTLDTASIKSDQPMVCFASPGMLHGGYSLQIFKDWAGQEKNTLIIPGYCMPGTVGNKLLSGEKKINIDGRDIDVRIKIYNMSFSAHADSKGIMELLSHLESKNVVLVHGEKQKMAVLKLQIEEQLDQKCYYPANYATLQIKTDPKVEMLISSHIINKMNRIYSQSGLHLYKANSQISLSEFLIYLDNNQNNDFQDCPIEILSSTGNLKIKSQHQQFDSVEDSNFNTQESMKDEHINNKKVKKGSGKSSRQKLIMDKYESVTMNLVWKSRQLNQDIQVDQVMQILMDLLVDSLMIQKKEAYNIKEFLFENDEKELAQNIGQTLLTNYLTFDEDIRKFSVSYGALENEVGEWLIKLIQKAIHNHSRQQEKQHKQIKEHQDDVVEQNDQLQMMQHQTIKQETCDNYQEQQDQMMDNDDEGQIMDLDCKAGGDSNQIIKEQDESNIDDNNQD